MQRGVGYSGRNRKRERNVFSCYTQRYKVTTSLQLTIEVSKVYRTTHNSPILRCSKKTGVYAHAHIARGEQEMVWLVIWQWQKKEAAPRWIYDAGTYLQSRGKDM